MMSAATLTMPKGRAAATTRRPKPQEPTARTDSHRTRNTGGTFRSALKRSRQGLSAFTWSFKSLLKIWTTREEWNRRCKYVSYLRCDATRVVMLHDDQVLDCL